MAWSRSPASFATESCSFWRRCRFAPCWNSAGSATGPTGHVAFGAIGHSPSDSDLPSIFAHPRSSSTASSYGSGGGGGAAGFGGGYNVGTAGGSGIVIVRVPSEFALTGSPTPARTLSTHPGGDKIAKFTASGTLTIGEA